MQEVDWYLTYSFNDYFSMSLNDYFVMDHTVGNNHYFNYKNGLTSHLNELSATFTGHESFPLTFMAATNVYGPDLIGYFTGSSSEEQNFSSYFELGYEHSIGDHTLNYFVGGTSHPGLFGDKAGIVNVGVTGSKGYCIHRSILAPPLLLRNRKSGKRKYFRGVGCNAKIRYILSELGFNTPAPAEFDNG